MNYKIIHDNFINYFKSTTPKERLLKRNPNDERLNKEYLYIEKHHIIPVSLGGSDEKENLVELLPEEHLFIHKLRYKAFNTREDFLAVRYIINGLNNKDFLKYEVTLHIIKKIRQSVAFIKQNKAEFRKKHGWQTKEGIERISRSKKGMVVVKDAKTEEIIGSVPNTHPKFLSGEWVHHSTGRTISDEERRKRSFANKGEKNGNFKFSDLYLVEIIQKIINEENPEYINFPFVIKYCRSNNIPFKIDLTPSKFKKLIKKVDLKSTKYTERILNRPFDFIEINYNNETLYFTKSSDALKYMYDKYRLSEYKTYKLMKKNYKPVYTLYKYDNIIKKFNSLNEIKKYCSENNIPFEALDNTVAYGGMLCQSNISKAKLKRKGYDIVYLEGMHLKFKYEGVMDDNN